MQVDERQAPREVVANSGFAARAARALHGELAGLRPRWLLASAFSRLLPSHALPRTRALILRLGGLELGRSSLVLGPIEFWGTAGQLRVGSRCILNSPLRVELEADVTLGDCVSVGHGVTFVTSNHELGPASHRSGALRPLPIVVEDGCLIGAGSMILPGVVIGRGSVITAGSVVAASVPSGRLFGGVPARLIRKLDD